MSREPVRFLHLTGLRVDSDPPWVPVLSAAARKILPRTVHRSLRNVVDAAIHTPVDFVLLAGETFDEASRSLRGRIVLREAFARLTEHDIPVVVVPGVSDPLPAWTEFPELPETVTIVGPGESAVIERNDSPLLVVEGVSRDSSWRAAEDVPASAWRLGVLIRDAAALTTNRTSRSRGVARPTWIDTLFNAVACDSGVRGHDIGNEDSILKDVPWDYAAPSGTERPLTVASDHAMLHSPGNLTSRLNAASGPRGGSLVTLREGRPPDVQLVPLAAAEEQAVVITLTAGDTEDELIHRMRDAISRQATSPTQECLLMHWTLRGSGQLFHSLVDSEYQQLLAGMVEETLSDRGICLGHSFRLWSTRFDRSVRVNEPESHQSSDGTWLRPVGRPSIWNGEDAGRAASTLLEHAGEVIRSFSPGSGEAGSERFAELPRWVAAEAAAHGLKVIPSLDAEEMDDVVGETARLLDAWLDDADDEKRGNS